MKNLLSENSERKRRVKRDERRRKRREVIQINRIGWGWVATVIFLIVLMFYGFPNKN
jgi:hypothetical protein